MHIIQFYFIIRVKSKENSIPTNICNIKQKSCHYLQRLWAQSYPSAETKLSICWEKQWNALVDFKEERQSMWKIKAANLHEKLVTCIHQRSEQPLESCIQIHIQLYSFLFPIRNHASMSRNISLLVRKWTQFIYLLICLFLHRFRHQNGGMCLKSLMVTWFYLS